MSVRNQHDRLPSSQPARTTSPTRSPLGVVDDPEDEPVVGLGPAGRRSRAASRAACVSGSCVLECTDPVSRAISSSPRMIASMRSASSRPDRAQGDQFALEGRLGREVGGHAGTVPREVRDGIPTVRARSGGRRCRSAREVGDADRAGEPVGAVVAVAVRVLVEVLLVVVLGVPERPGVLRRTRAAS